MAKIEFTSSKLKAIIDKAKEESKKTSSFDKGIPIAFLPEGKHKIRLFFDPMNELYRTVVTHKSPKGQILCPNYLGEKDTSKEYPECDFCRIADDKEDWRLNRRFNVMTYGQLIQTDSPGDYWEAGKVYCLVGNTKYRKAIDSFISSLYEDSAEYLMTLFDPQNAGGYLSIDVTKGNQGTIAITVIPGKSVEPVDTADWWKPLEETWISPEFKTERWVECRTAFLQEQGEMEAPAEGSEEGKAQQSEDASASKTAVTTQDAPAKVEAKPEPVVEKPVAIIKDGKQVQLKDGRIVDLPDEVVDNKCWSQYDPSNAVCIICEVSADCMMSSMNS